MTEVELLQQARARLLVPNGWCQGQLIRSVEGVEQVCALRALSVPLRRARVQESTQTAYLDAHRRVTRLACVHLNERLPRDGALHPLAQVNDYLGLAAVVAVFDDALLECAAESSVRRDVPQEVLV